MVTPSAASIVTVNAVCSGASFFAGIRCRPSSSQRSGVSARQIRPARLLGHEVDRLGRRELRREHQVALVLAVLAVADDDHPPAADVLERLLDRREEARPVRSSVLFLVVSWLSLIRRSSVRG